MAAILILNPHQAEAFCNIMRAVDEGGGGRASVAFRNSWQGHGHGDIQVSEGQYGGVTVCLHEKVETHASQAAFANAYGQDHRGLIPF